MAIQPCQVCHRRFVGPASRAYIAILNGKQRWEHRPRLCPQHYFDLVAQFKAVDGFINPESDAVPEQLKCLVCHVLVRGKETESVFMTGFPARAEREDYFAAVCRDCRLDAEVVLRGE